MGKNISEIERGVGFLQGLFTGLMDIAREKAVPFDAIHRLGTARGRGTLSKLVDLAQADWLAEQPQQPEVGLPPGHYRMRVTDAPLPSLVDLKREFGAKNVSDIYDGRAWELHSSCTGMDRTPGERTFYLHDVGRDWKREEQIVWGLQQRSAVAPNGYRPATPEEHYEFVKAHPELTDFAALGSSTPLVDHSYVASVWSFDGQRFLGYDWIDDGFDASLRVLFVSK